jgi:serine protease AprX
MPIKIPRSLVEFILLGPEDDRRQLQDSPILGDVWVEFAKNPDRRVELLITPYKETAAVAVVKALVGALTQEAHTGDVNLPGGEETNIAYLQGIVAARLTLEEVLRFVVPLTSWWSDPRIANRLKDYLDDVQLVSQELRATREEAFKWLAGTSESAIQDLETRRRYAALAGVILWAARQPDDPDAERLSPKAQAQRIVERIDVPAVADRLRAVFEQRSDTPEKPLVWTVSLNRRATPALTHSIPAVKADAARTLFTVDCSQLIWAVIDSGIDATHDAFLDKKGQPRVERAFDFTRIREIVTLDNLRDTPGRRARISRLVDQQSDPTRALKKPLNEAEAIAKVEQLAGGAKEGRPINWELVEQLVELDPARSRPPTNHGTHVAGILGASKHGAVTAAAARSTGTRGVVPESTDWADGICPDIRIYDFRVLAPTLRETEFAIIAALQYIRYINERNSYMTIHGANLSLSIPHDVRNFACGRTPVCNECERLVSSGVVVVAAAGNRGYQNFETTEGQFESYAAFSVTDPGNADGVITVGATHRYWPHTYGVSFFSSRGPTGDGRIKPDLVAPGERIRATLPDNEWGDLDGTSMAAPHVSGAAAMLLARYSELVGQPRRIKRVLCESATDLGRERSFQGHGMLDVLRAFQSI